MVLISVNMFGVFSVFLSISAYIMLNPDIHLILEIPFDSCFFSIFAMKLINLLSTHAVRVMLNLSSQARQSWL